MPARCRQLRDKLGDTHRQRSSQPICDHILKWAGFLSSASDLTCLPVRREVDPRPLIAAAPTIR